MFPGLEMYYADPAQPLTTASEDRDGLYHDMSKVCNITSKQLVFSRVYVYSGVSGYKTWLHWLYSGSKAGHIGHSRVPNLVILVTPGCIFGFIQSMYVYPTKHTLATLAGGGVRGGG